MIKSILGGKSKNLFDISKADVVINANIFNPILAKWECFYKIPVTPGQTYTVSCDTTANICAGEQLQLSAQTGDKWGEGTRLFIFITSQEMVKDWVHIKATFTIPDNITQITFSALSSKFFRNFQIELGSTATEYVPHELTSYKSIMKVSDVCQLVDPKYIHTIIDRGVTFTNNGDGSITINGTPTGTYYSVGTIALDTKSIKFGHKYIAYSTDYQPVVSQLIIANYQGGYFYKGANQIFTFPEYDYTRFVFEIRVNLNQTANNIVVRPQLFDLTERFGAGNEPKTVAEFKAKFPNDYYPYSPSCFVISFDERMPCKTKNLFSSSTEVGTLEGGFGGPTVTRNLEENKWYRGFTTNGYYSPGNVRDFDIHPNSLYVYSSGAGYGMSRAIKCEPNTDYFIFCSYSLISGGEGNVYVGYFDEGGNFISNLNMDMKYKFVITTPSNCKWLIINFTTRGVGKVYFSDIQLVKGTTATDYVPYGYV